MDKYHLPDGYNHRLDNHYFDDMPFKDEWQRQVYEFARKIADKEGHKVICDIGCGSGFKLLKYFGDLTTMGTDLLPTIYKLRKLHPDRLWIDSDFRTPLPMQADLIIASDVIEHLVEPDEMLNYIKLCAPKKIIISTPDGDLRHEDVRRPMGPPWNAHHVREWNFAQFGEYIADHFKVEQHFVPNKHQNTQCILCTI